MSRRTRHNVMAAGIIVITVILAIVSFWDDAPIVDEIPHIGAGYSYLTQADYRLNPEHPPLVKDIAALPLLFLDINQSVFNIKAWQSDINGQWEFGRYLIYYSGANTDLLIKLVKLPMLLFFIISGWLLFYWTRKLYGDKAGFIALILFTFSPTIMAHSRFVTTDMAALTGTLFSIYFFLKYLAHASPRNMLLAGLSLGIALVLKFSTALLVPFFITLAVIHVLVQKNTSHLISKLWSILIHTTAVFVIALSLVVWPLYALHTKNYPPERQRRDTQQILTQIYGDSYQRYNWILGPVINSTENPILRPFAQYMLGFLRVAHQTIEPHAIYFLGEVRLYGSHAYFPIVYFIKEPLAWWALFIMATLFLGWQLQKPSNKTPRNLIVYTRNNPVESTLILWLILYWFMSIRGTLDIGVRHLLPTYPFIILLVSGQLSKIGHYLKEKSRSLILPFNILIFAFLGWYVTENFRVFPYYLTYFNQAVGGSDGGYEYVTDSNLDWGQDLARLGRWVKNNNIERIETDYFGWADPAYYLGSAYERLGSTKYRNALDFQKRNTSNGWLAVSATFMQLAQGPTPGLPNYGDYTWLKNHQPVTVIGNSIFIYQIK